MWSIRKNMPNDWKGVFKHVDVLSLHLDSIETSHVHLNQPVLPVVPWDSGVVNAAWDELKWLLIFEETVVFVVYRKCSFSRELQEMFEKVCIILSETPPIAYSIIFIICRGKHIALYCRLDFCWPRIQREIKYLPVLTGRELSRNSYEWSCDFYIIKVLYF